MNEVKWNDRFNIGVEGIDKAHRRLFSIGNHDMPVEPPYADSQKMLNRFYRVILLLQLLFQGGCADAKRPLLVYLIYGENMILSMLSETQRGCCEVEGGSYEMTIYTSCCNADKGVPCSVRPWISLSKK